MVDLLHSNGSINNQMKLILHSEKGSSRVSSTVYRIIHTTHEIDDWPRILIGETIWCVCVCVLKRAFHMKPESGCHTLTHTIGLVYSKTTKQNKKRKTNGKKLTHKKKKVKTKNFNNTISSSLLNGSSCNM